MTSLLFATIAVQETFSVRVGSQTFATRGPIFSFSDGGFMMYPITFCAIMVVILAGWTALRMKTQDPGLGALTRGASRRGAHFFWGA